MNAQHGIGRQGLTVDGALGHQVVTEASDLRGGQSRQGDVAETRYDVAVGDGGKGAKGRWR